MDSTWPHLTVKFPSVRRIYNIHLSSSVLVKHFCSQLGSFSITSIREQTRRASIASFCLILGALCHLGNFFGIPVLSTIHKASQSNMAAVLKQKIRSSVLNWKLSIETNNKKDNSFKDNVFGELGSLMESVFDKYDGSVRRNHCHSIVDIWPMTERIIEKLHQGIYKRLRATPVTASPYFGSFTREVPREVFDVILNAIIKHNRFGHTVRLTAAQVNISVHEKRKAVWFFDHMNDNGVKFNKDELLMKKFDDGSCAKVLVSEEQPMILKYSMNCETLKITFHYGVWNYFGVAQH